DRVGGAEPSGRRGSRGLRAAERGVGSDRGRGGRAEARGRAVGRGDRRLLQAASGELQEAREDRLLERAAAQSARQGAQEGPEAAVRALMPRSGGPVVLSRRGHLAELVVDLRASRGRFTPEAAVAFSQACAGCDDEAVWVVWLRSLGTDFCRGIEGS